MLEKVVVTGGAGFIGSHVVEALIHDHSVTVLDNLSSGSRSNLARVGSDRLSLIPGDIRDYSTVRNAVRGSSIVFHFAAETSVPASVRNPALTYEVNANGTLNLLKACVENGVRRFVFASTCAVYGNSKSSIQNENSPLGALSPYGTSKLMGEEYCRKFYGSNDLETICLRFFNVYGPRQKPGRYAGVISTTLDRVARKVRPMVNGDGGQTRDFVYVSDVVSACILSMQSSSAVGQRLNIGTGQPTSIGDLIQTILNILGMRDMGIMRRPARPGDIRNSCADINKAKSILGYAPRVELTEGLQRLIRSQNLSHKHFSR